MFAKISYLIFMLLSALLFKLTFDIQTFDFGLTGPETFPRVTTILTFILSAILFVGSILKKENIDLQANWSIKQLIALAAFIIYIVLLDITGYIPTTLVFIIFFILTFTSRRSLKEFGKASLISVVTVFTLYYIFEIELKVFLP